MFIFAELMAAGFYYLAFLRRCRIEKVFVFTILCLGVIYNFTLTPYMTPDESYHIDMCYRHSNTLLGIESAGENKMLQAGGGHPAGNSPQLPAWRIIKTYTTACFRW